MNQQVLQLIQRVASRQRLVSLGRWFYIFTLWLAAAYAVLLLTSRLMAVIPDYFTPPTLLFIIALAALLAMILHKKPTVNDTARAIDARTGSKDLFLTASMIEQSPGEYQPLVLEAAQKQAGSVRPDAVVPFDFWPKAGKATGALALVLLAGMVFPQFDPFGHQEQRKKEAEKKQRLEVTIKAAEAQAQLLKQQPLDAAQSKEVDMALEQVKLAFNQMKPQDPAGNLQRLNQQQAEVGKLWQKAAEERLKDSLDKSPNDQKFGSSDSEKSKQWEQDLQQGKTDSLQKEAQELKDLAEKMQKETDPAAKEAQQKEMEKRLSDLNDFASKQMSKQSLNDALNGAQQQAAACNNPQLAKQAAEGLAKSISLTQAELKQVAQLLRDRQALEQALQAMQAAKAASSAGKPLDGSQCKNCNAMADYIKMYNSMCNNPGSGNAQPKLSMAMKDMLPKPAKGGGQGDGSRRPENPNTPMAFKPEKSESALVAGKNLLEWKDKGVSESGAVQKNYAQSIQDIKQGVSEAILKEEIPPGYVGPIQKYFDSVEKVRPKPADSAGK